MVVKVISLDFAGVIAPKYFIDYFWFEAIPRELAKRKGMSIEEARRFVEKAYDSVPQTRIEWYLPSYWVKEFGIEDALEDMLRESLEVATVYGDAAEVIPVLASRYTLVISTNTTLAFLEPFIEKFDFLRKYVTAVFTCVDHLKMPRKSREFYRWIAAQLGVKPSEVLHVGDDPQTDVVEAREAGFRAVLMDRSSKYAKHDAISSLHQIFDYL